MKQSSCLVLMLCTVMAFTTASVKATPITIDVKFKEMVNGAETMSPTLHGSSPASAIQLGMIGFSYSNASAALPFTLGADLWAFCIEFSQLLKTNQTVSYDILPTTDFFRESTAEAIGRLYTGFGKFVGNSTANAAAFQLALWELIYDFEDNNFAGLSLTAGNFNANSTNASVVLAQDWLGQLSNIENKFNLYVMSNEQSQNQLIFSGISITTSDEPVPVSAPATIGILGLGLLGLALRRRQRPA